MNMRPLVGQFAKFAIVGTIAFVIDFGLMVLLRELFGMNTVLAATISFSVSVVFNYFASMRYVFTHREGMGRRREFAIFIVLSVIGLALNDLLMWAGTTYTAIDYRLVKIVTTMMVTIYNFFSRKIFLDGSTERS